GAGSPFLSTLPLAEHGLEWIHPDAPLAHPLPDGSAAILERSLEATVAGLGADGQAWARLLGPLARGWPERIPDLLAPPRLPRHPIALAGTGLRALWPARTLARALFAGEPARALLAGLAAHSVLPLERLMSAAIAV